MAPSTKSARYRMLWLSEEDISAAARLASLLNGGTDEDSARKAKLTDKSHNRREALEKARLSLYLRQRRIEHLGQIFSNEPAFQMLLSLYVSEDREPTMTLARLTNVASLTPSTGLRTLHTLMKGGWIIRSGVAHDRRKSQIALTKKAREAMDELFSLSY